MIIDHVEWCGSVLGTVIQRPCVFEDVEGCIDKGVYKKDDPFRVKFVKIAKADLLSHQACKTHNKLCPLFGPKAQSDIETAGLPCVDSSKAGKKLYEEGRTGSVFCCHAKRHIEKETPLILLENVQDRSSQKRVE